MKLAVKHHRKSRSGTGYSVLYVISIALIALIGVMAVTDALVSTQRNVASQLYMNESSSLAENALQYSLALINTAAANGNLSNVPPVISIPPNITGNASITVTMTQLDQSKFLNTTSTPTPTPTPIINPQLNTVQPTQDFRLLTAKATYGTFSRTINVIIGPNIFSKQSSPTTTPYFSQALLSNNQMLIDGVDVQFDSAYKSSSQYSTASYAPVIASSNGSMQLSGQVSIDGSVNAYNYLVPGASGGNGTPPPIVINGNVAYTGSSTNPYSGFIPDSGGSSAPSNVNVLGDSLTSATGGTKNAPGTITNDAATTQQAPAQTQFASAIAQSNTSVLTNGSQSTTVLAPSSGVVTDLGSINLSGSNSLTLSPGQYVVNSITTTPGSTIIVNMPGTSSPAPVQIYVQGDAPGDSAIQMQGNVQMLNSSAASNLQIFYNGSNSVQINQPGTSKFNFTGQIYAPNSTVSINTTGGAFDGAVVANNLNLTGTGNFFYDPRTIASNAGAGALPNGAAAGPGYTLNANNLPSQFYVLSWQEITTGNP